MYNQLFDFETALAAYTGAPYAVLTDGCTHAIELCMRYNQVAECEFTAYTYLSIPMMLAQLHIKYTMLDQTWTGEYQFKNTRIWDSARRLEPGMYRAGAMQCLSFGNGKPLNLGRVGAVLLDDYDAYCVLSRLRSDGRDLRISPWESDPELVLGYHYCPTLELCERGIEKLATVDQEPKYHQYPDLRTIDFKFG